MGGPLPARGRATAARLWATDAAWPADAGSNRADAGRGVVGTGLVSVCVVQRTASHLETLPVAARPRERLRLFGCEALTDVELVALVLGGGRSLERGGLLLGALGGVEALALATPEELSRLPGVGEAGAAALAAGFELSRRRARATLPIEQPLRRPADVATFVQAHLDAALQEHFVIIGLDVRQRVRLVRTVAVGSLSQVDVHPREVFRPLLRAGMHAAIVVHNHPSGDPTPSDADLELTRRLVAVGRVTGIPVVDHLIVARGRWHSIAETSGMPDPE